MALPNPFALRKDARGAIVTSQPGPLLHVGAPGFRIARRPNDEAVENMKGGRNAKQRHKPVNIVIRTRPNIKPLKVLGSRFD